MGDASGSSAEMVLLRHEGSPAGDHWDWLLARPERPQGALLAFRIWVRCDGPEAWEFDAEKLQDHRSLYLTFEGELTGARGVVRREARGTVLLLGESSTHIDLLAQWEGDKAPRRWEFTRTRDPQRERWQVQATPRPTR